MTGPLDRLDESQYGDPDDHRPAHVEPPQDDDGDDRDDGRHYCDAADRVVIGLGDRDRCPFCWQKREDLGGGSR